MKRWIDSVLHPNFDRVPEEDVGRYLGFFGVVPWLLYALAVVQVAYSPLVVIGVEELRTSELTVLIVLLASFSLITFPSVTPLPMWRTLVILVVVVSSVVIVLWPQPYQVPLPPTAGWELNPCSLLLFCLVFRGRFVAGWFGGLAMQGVFAIWSIQLVGTPWYGLSYSYGQLLPLVGVTMFAIGLHRTVERIVAHRAAERERADRESRMMAEEAHMEEGLAEVRELAGPILKDIASGSNPEVSRVRGLEAALRDMIRGRSLAREPLASELRGARENGMDIVVLDDSGEAELSENAARVLVAWAADEVRNADGREMTLRLTLENGVALVTASVDGNPSSETSTSA
ncbi:hypothetical protein [Brevibacterium sp.]|uniref:hypothetical protein n=1 Tax=Brevibacterium sp. TaxID=1701 RepID=UPI0028120CDE|nr:hypothetical protein [Brevibacterium sp.]